MSQSTIMRNSTGICFDFTNFFGADKIKISDIEELDNKIIQAAEAISVMRQSGFVKGHLSKDGLSEKVLFTKLPYIKEGNINSPQSIRQLLDFAQASKNNVDAVISLGIGGSFLGNKVLFDFSCSEFWNQKCKQERDGWPALYFSGNNIDGVRTQALLSAILKKATASKQSTGQDYKVTLLVISKSGSTLETMSSFMYIYSQLKSCADIIVDVAVVTEQNKGEQETLLHRLACKNGWQMFSFPDGVGGRFSVFSDVGLITAALTGLDIEAFLSGARDMDKACQNSNPFENMALLNAVLKFIAAERYGRDIEVFMPYADNLKSLSAWYTQLLAESLGKEKDKDGTTVYYGRTPVAAVGTTDMHAQTQQHQEGKLDKVVQFVKIEKWENDPITPDFFPEEEVLSKMAGIPFSKALNAALEANAQALSSNGRFNATIVLPEASLYHLGALMYMLALSIAYEGELANVDAFDQPGVESYKKILKKKLADLQEQ